MLGALRKRKNSPVITFLLGLTALLMIGFGVSFQGLSTAGSVGYVNGEPIDELDFNARYTVTFRERQGQNPGYDRTEAQKQGLREQVLNGMMNEKILSQKGAEWGLAVDDRALRRAITTNPQFQTEDGQFDINRYQRVLNYMRTSDHRFEKQYREQLLAQPLTSMLQVIGPSEPEVRARFELEERKVVFSFVQFEKRAFMDKVEVTDADVEAWKKATEDVDGAVQAYYKQNKSRKYDVPEKVCAQQILIKADPTPAPDTAQARTKKIQDVVARVKKGEDFGALAKELSDDASASRNGDLGCFTYKAYEKSMPTFAEAAFALKAGEYSNLVKTPFGTHIIKVNEVQKQIRKKLEEVRGEIERALARTMKAEATAKSQAEAFLAEAQKQENLAAAIAAFTSEIELTEEAAAPLPRTRTFVPKLGTAKDVLAAVWQMTDEAPLPASPIETERAWVVPRFKERIEPDDTKYEEARKYITFQLTRQKQNQVVEAWFKAMRQKADTSYDPVYTRYDEEAQAIRSARRNRM